MTPFACPNIGTMSEDAHNRNRIATFLSVIPSGFSARSRRLESRFGVDTELTQDSCVEGTKERSRQNLSAS
jgi:hypothetical protein